MTFLFLGFSVAIFSACSDDPESEPKGQETIIPHFELGYKVTEDMLDLMNIEINYWDLAGKKHSEAMTETTWNKTFVGEVLPAKVGYKVQCSLKGNISLDKEIYKIGGGMYCDIYTMQGSEKNSLQLTFGSSSSDISKNRILEALEKRYIEDSLQYVWEITANGTLAESPTIDWSE